MSKVVNFIAGSLVQKGDLWVVFPEKQCLMTEDPNSLHVVSYEGSEMESLDAPYAWTIAW